MSPDEATTTHSAVADQLIQGHQWLQQTFGVTPTIGFQIDPFGASTTVAQLWKSAGFTHHIIDRMNFRTKDLLKQKKALQFLWYPSAADTTAPGTPFISPNFGPPIPGKAHADLTLDLETTSTQHIKDDLSTSSYRNTASKPEKLASTTRHLFTHILDDNYCFPLLDGFDFEGDEAKNPKITNENMLARADAYAQQIRKRSKEFRIPRLLMLHNCDFRYQQAHLQFDNMDKIIDFINGHPERYNVSIKWSSLTDYFSAVDSEYPPGFWPVRGEDDFLPYDDNDESWWVGFYSSRPELKGIVRKSEAELRIVDNLFSYMALVDPSNAALKGSTASQKGKSFVDPKYENSANNRRNSISGSSTRIHALNATSTSNLVDNFHRALGIAQHHDAVSGTERQLVAENYAYLLSTAQTATDPIVEAYINYIASKPDMFSMEPRPSSPKKKQSHRASSKHSSSEADLFINNQGSQYGKSRSSKATMETEAETGPSFSRLPKDLEKLVPGTPVTVLIYNSLRKSRYEIVKVPVWNNDIVVQDRKGKTLVTSILTNLQVDDKYNSPYTLFIEAQHLPPAGFLTLTLTRTGDSNPPPASQPQPVELPATITNGKDGLTVKVDYNGKISSVIVEGSPMPFLQDLKAYHSYAGPGQASGAYIFRPNSTKAYSLTQTATAVVRDTPLVKEIFQTFAPYVNVTTRLYNNPQLYLDVTYRIGPLPGNHELISRFETAIATEKGQIATDNNGWAVMNRKERRPGALAYSEAEPADSHFEPIAANYYPAVYSSFLHPPNGGAHFAIVTDRTHGVASVDKGALELMLHRRLLQDDARGLDQALNDTSIVTMSQRFVFASDIYTGTTLRWHYALETNYPLALFYSPIGGYAYNSKFTSAFNASHELPKGIQSFSRLLNSNSGKILMRYAYQYSYTSGFSPVNLDLSLAFGPLAGAKICSVQETNLSGTTTIGSPLPPRTSITIYPKEFRTFVYTPCAK